MKNMKNLKYIYQGRIEYISLNGLSLNCYKINGNDYYFLPEVGLFIKKPYEKIRYKVYLMTKKVFKDINDDFFVECNDYFMISSEYLVKKDEMMKLENKIYNKLIFLTHSGLFKVLKSFKDDYSTWVFHKLIEREDNIKKTRRNGKKNIKRQRNPLTKNFYLWLDDQGIRFYSFNKRDRGFIERGYENIRKGKNLTQKQAKMIKVAANSNDNRSVYRDLKGKLELVKRHFEDKSHYYDAKAFHYVLQDGQLSYEKYKAQLQKTVLWRKGKRTKYLLNVLNDVQQPKWEDSAFHHENPFPWEHIFTDGHIIDKKNHGRGGNLLNRDEKREGGKNHDKHDKKK